MIHGKMILSAVTILAALAVCGADPVPAQTPSAPSPEPRRGGFGGRGGMRAQMEKINATLKEKFPAEYAEIEKLRETDRMGAMRKIMELAGKAGIEMPWGRRGMMGRRFEHQGAAAEEWQKFFAALKEKAPEELAAIEKKMVSEPQSVMAELKALAEKHGLQMPEGPLPQGGRPQISMNRNRNRFLIERANRILAHSCPEKYAELQKLRESDDNAAREYFRKLVKEEGISVQRLLAEPIRPVRSYSYSDKDIAEQYPMPTSGQRSWGGWRGNFGGRSFGGFRGR